MLKITGEIKDLLELGYSLSTERYYLRLFDLILDGCMKFTSADAGTLFIENNGKLRRLIVVNKSLGIHEGRGEAPIADSVAEFEEHDLLAYTVQCMRPVNIADIYQEKQFEILNIKEFDAKNNYRTQSILNVPIIQADGKLMGVIQLTNCLDDDNQVIPFPEEYEKMVSSLTSQMAITLTNMMLIQDLEELLFSFVEAMTTAIDERTPYNAHHTTHVAEYCMEVIDHINALYTRGEYKEFIGENDREQLYLAALLHDLGKMITPREILNKSTRLGLLYDGLMNKLERISLLMKIDMLEGRMDSAEWAMADLRLSNFRAELPGINIRERLNDSEIYRINDMARRVYVAPDGTEIPYLNEEEKKALNIVKGTLTMEERKTVEQHVVYTDKMLDKIRFNEKYDRVQRIASRHHEYLDGSGYPDHLTAENLDLLTRILTIVDIFESLTSNDRPYKGTVPVHKAVEILTAMAKEGKLDEDLVRIIGDYMKKRNAMNY